MKLDNKEYLAKCKERRDVYMKDVEKSIDEVGNSVQFEEMKAKGREIHALEIIAEALISIDDKIDKVIPYIECIPASINRR